jgi:cyclohexanone monooxygenase
MKQSQSAKAPLRPAYDAIVVGAGFAGLYMVHTLRGLGLSVHCFEAGDEVGGTWYWNRYPGARCDVESQQYSFSFCKEIEDEWIWTERYSGQPEILSYLKFVADRLDLRKDISLGTRVTAAIYDDTSQLWSVSTATGESVHAQHCIMATGCLSAAQMPAIAGRDTFKGEIYHTGQWPHGPVTFEGKHVGVVGTGSSGIQIIPQIAKDAKHLSVLQRTPNFSIPAWNMPLAAEKVADWRTNRDDYRQRAKASRAGILYEYATRSAYSVSDHEREREYERRWARGGANFVHAFNDLFLDKNANDTAAEFVRRKIRSLVEDPNTARKLLPYDHAIGTKRICVDTEYYTTFNKPNVELVDLCQTTIKQIVPGGIEVTDRYIPLDMIVFATGFDAVTGALSRIDIRGRGGLSLKDKWHEGPKSYLGLAVTGFPNMFVITGPGSPSITTNVVMAIEQHVEWIGRCLNYMRAKHRSTIEADDGAQEDWVEHVRTIAAGTLFPTAKSWYMGANIPGKPRVFLPFIGGLGTYTQTCDDVARDGYRGFTLA